MKNEVTMNLQKTERIELFTMAVGTNTYRYTQRV